MTKKQPFVPQKSNANKHTAYGTRLLESAIQKDGWIGAMTSTADNEIFDGSNRIGIVEDKFVNENGEVVEPIIVHSDGKRPVIVIRDDIPNANNARARRLSVAANKIAHVDFDPDFALLQEWGAEDVGIKELFSEREWQEGTGIDISGVEKGKKPNPRKLPLDIIYTLQMADCTCCLAVQAGWKYGINSAHYRLCPYTHQLSDRHEVAFIDNDYFKYNHAKHLDTARMIKPKYCTVRDIMTKEQCKADNIAYYSFEQIMVWAEELVQYAENVIVIPKYDCIKDIPEKFMLGYSIPTSHGGTPLSVDLFRGRRVHLLGGSWKAQLDYLAELGEDVVSLDNNYIRRMSDFGSFVYPDGSTGQITQDLHLDYAVNPMYISLAISFGNIAAKVNELYGGNG